jgi:IclR family acetate operon transcriptional repressor
MVVKRSKSGSRMLVVLEEIARCQPVGMTELARRMGEDKSGIQRSMMTLADAGWISMAPDTSRWSLTSHIQVVAQYARENDDLRRTARPIMDRLRDACGETVLLAVPDQGQFVVIEVSESEHLLRTAPRVGLVIGAQDTVTSRTIVPYLPLGKQEEFLGRSVTAAERDLFELTLQRGFAVSTHTHAHTHEGRQAIGSTNVGAPIFDHEGNPVASLMVSGPTERITEKRQTEIGQLTCAAAQDISRGKPRVIASQSQEFEAQPAAN